MNQRMKNAVEIIEKYGWIDGDHHKAWVIDQILRSLIGEDYEKWIKNWCDGEDGEDTYSWNTGIAP